MYNRNLVFAAACLGMLTFGVVLTTLGSLLPSLIERFGIDRANAGLLLMLMSVGILLGSVVFGPIVDRYGHKGLLLLGLLLVLAGLEGIAFASSLLWLRLSILLVGFGGGVINGGTNALVADISEHGRAAGLSLLGVFVGVGAVGVPFSLGMLLDTFSYGSLMAAVGLALIVPLAFTAALRFPRPKQAQGLPIRQGVRLAGDRVLLLFGLILFLQSGIEITVAGWTAPLVQERLALSGSYALFFVSLFWFGMMLARLALGTVLAGLSGPLLLPAGIVLALAGFALLMGSTTPALAGTGIFVVGAGLAAGFPLVLGWVGDRYAALSGTAFSIVLVMALTGGSLLPWLTGVLGGAYGLGASLLIVPVALLLQLVLSGVLQRRAAATSEPEAVAFDVDPMGKKRVLDSLP